MADTRLTSSIESLRQKLKDQIPNANAEQLKRISRSARKLGYTQDTEIETLLNTRANTLIAATSDPSEVETIASALNEMDDTINPTISTAGTIVGGASKIVTDDSAPGNPEDGDLWFKTDDLDLYVYYDDGDTSQWVQVNAASLGENALVTTSSSSPTNPVVGQLWFDTNTNILYAYHNAQWVQTGSGGNGGVTVYADIAALIAATGMSDGDQALVQSNNNLYMYIGTGWYKVATVENLQPASITGVNASYALATDGTPTVITAISNDPEGLPLTWSYAVTSGSLGTTAIVSQTENVFTITPGTTDPDDAGTFEITFSVTDGVNSAVNAVSSFTLEFAEKEYHILPSDYGMTTANISGAVIDGNEGNLFVLGYSGDQSVYRWTLGTPGALASIPASQTQTRNISTATPSGFYLKPDGSKYYYASYNSVYQVDMTYANDLSPATETSAFETVSAQELDNGGLIFGATLSHTGDKLYISETTNQTIREHPLNTNWDITTAQNATNTFDPSEVNYPHTLYWSHDGMKLWVAQTRYIYEYSASTAYSLSGMSTTASASFDTQNLNNAVDNFTANNIGSDDIRGISVANDGVTMYLTIRPRGVFKLTMATQNTIADGFIL